MAPKGAAFSNGFPGAALYRCPFSLDRDPGFYFFSGFDGEDSPVHNEGRAIFLVVDRLSFKFTARFERCSKAFCHLLVGTHTLENSGCFSYHFFGLVSS